MCEVRSGITRFAGYFGQRACTTKGGTSSRYLS